MIMLREINELMNLYKKGQVVKTGRINQEQVNMKWKPLDIQK